MSLGDAVWGAALGYVLLYLSHVLYLKWRDEVGLGLGDAKLLAAVGASSMIISKENYQLAVAVIVVSLLLSPLLISRMRRYALGGDELHKEP